MQKNVKSIRDNAFVTPRRDFLVGAAASTFAVLGSNARAQSYGDLQQRITAASSSGGGTVYVSGQTGLRTTLKVPSNVTLRGEPGAALFAENTLKHLIKIERNAVGVTISGLLLDGRGLCQNLVHGLGVENCTVDGCVGINWQYGIVLGSHMNRNARNIQVSNLRLVNPALNAVYPLWIKSGTAGPLVEGFRGADIFIQGIRGAYSRKNASTADQITLHGVRNFELARATSLDGGEVGITVARLCANGVLRDCVANTADGHGYNIGSGFIVADVMDGYAFREGDRFTTNTRYEGTIQKIEGNRLFINRSVKGRLEIGDEIFSNGRRSYVQAVHRTEKIALVNCRAHDNWINAGGTGGTGAGALIQQADDIALYNCVMGNTNGGYQAFGLLAAQSTVGWQNCNFNGNIKGETKLAGKSRQISISPVAP